MFWTCILEVLFSNTGQGTCRRAWKVSYYLAVAGTFVSGCYCGWIQIGRCVHISRHWCVCVCVWVCVVCVCLCGVCVCVCMCVVCVCVCVWCVGVWHRLGLLATDSFVTTLSPVAFLIITSGLGTVALVVLIWYCYFGTVVRYCYLVLLI